MYLPGSEYEHEPTVTLRTIPAVQARRTYVGPVVAEVPTYSSNLVEKDSPRTVPSLDFDDFQSVPTAAAAEEEDWGFGRRNGEEVQYYVKKLNTRSAEGSRATSELETFNPREMQREKQPVAQERQFEQPVMLTPPEEGEDEAKRRSFHYGRALYYPDVHHSHDDDLKLLEHQPHQFANVIAHGVFTAGHSRGNGHHHVEDAQQRDGHRHREEVRKGENGSMEILVQSNSDNRNSLGAGPIIRVLL